MCELEIKFGMSEEESHRTDVLDAEEIRQGIEDLVHGDEDADEHEPEQHDPPRGGAA